MRYRRVDMIDRCDIQRLKEEGKRQKEIAKILKFHPSTISRELKRKGAYRNDEYYYGWAQEAADACLLKRILPRKLKLTNLRYVLEKLACHWSPDQISKRMQIDIGQKISAETIYRMLEKDKLTGGSLYLFLRRSKRFRRKRFAVARGPSKQDLFPSIEERDEVIDRRERIGDWERDTMFGDSRRKAILVLVERKTRYIKLKKLDAKKQKLVSKYTEELIEGLPAKSITNDRGFEFYDYKDLNRKIPVYFCHPYTSQERGSVENAIGLVRQYLPKKFDISSLTEEDLKCIEIQLNSRPRKVLDYKTPSEIMNSVAMCS